MATLWRCIFGPPLYRLHKTQGREGRLYELNTAEHGSENLIRALKVCKSLCYWTSPFLLIVLYRRGWLTSIDGLMSLARYAVFTGLLLAGAVLTRGIGRYTNPDYLTFIGVLVTARKSLSQESRLRLSTFDFGFHRWPVDFRWFEGSRGDGSKQKVYVPISHRARPILDHFKALPCYMLSYLAANTFGRRMVYPGSTSLLNALLTPALVDGRSKLVEQKKGLRAKLLTEDGNEIDSMFVDKRNSGNENGTTLVICSEGNAAFYEVGCMMIPLEKGYSVLGWNHPGFGGSTGVPWTDQEQNAIDVVMQYAIHKLGFLPENIILFSWSIGGYCSSWAAMNYPDVSCLILDATFDELKPLAIARMPPSCSSLVRLTVKTYMNLNIAEQVCRYPGPVLLIRRTNDEMITTLGQTVLASNRGNDLLIKLLQYRYPCVINESTIPVLREWLRVSAVQQVLTWSQYEVDEQLCQSTIESHVEKYGTSYPSELGNEASDLVKTQLALYLASRHLSDLDSTHCTPLPVTYFKKPWKFGVTES